MSEKTASKREVIEALIKAGNTFDQVVELSGASVSYTRGVYTRNGLDWRKHDAQQEAKEEEPEAEVSEPEQVEAVVEEPEDEVEAVPEPVPEPEPEPKQESPVDKILKKNAGPAVNEYKGEKSALYVECEELLVKTQKAKFHPVFAARCKRLIEMIEVLLRDGNFAAQKQSAIIARYRRLVPVPSVARNKEIYLLNKKVKLLFAEFRNK